MLEVKLVHKFKTLEEVKLGHILQVLKSVDYSASKACQILQVERKTVYLILKRNGYALHKKKLYNLNEVI